MNSLTDPFFFVQSNHRSAKENPSKESRHIEAIYAEFREACCEGDEGGCDEGEREDGS